MSRSMSDATSCIDLLIVDGEQFLVSPAAPNRRFPVKPADGTDRSGMVWSLQQFRKELAANAGCPNVEGSANP